jgi:UrcA family protein
VFAEFDSLLNPKETTMKTMINTRYKSIAYGIAAAIIALSAGVGAPRADAAEQADVLTKNVGYRDLDLNSEMGARVLYGRLRNAAREVCAPLEGGDLNTKMLWKKCYDHAISAAVSEINKPVVTAVHNESVRHGAKS